MGGGERSLEKTQSNISVMILSDLLMFSYTLQIFLWVGNFANKKETKEAWIHAQEYLRIHPAGRDQDTAVVFIKQGYEPLTFTGWFSSWDPHKWSVRP